MPEKKKITIEIDKEDYNLLHFIYKYHGGPTYAIRKFIKEGLEKLRKPNET